MKHRIFVAVDLPPELKQDVAEVIRQWHWLPIRWLKPAGWHITLVPPVSLEDGELKVLKNAFKRGRFGKPFPVRFTSVMLAPPGMASRMIWLDGTTPPALVELRQSVEALWVGAKTLPPLTSEGRPFRLHATLARFEAGDLKELEAKTRVLGEVDFTFTADRVAIMESHMRTSGAEYETVATAPINS